MRFTAETVSGVDPFATRLRVLHVLQPGEAGVWRYASDMSGFQSAHGWQVHVASPVPVPSEATWHRWDAERDPTKGFREESTRFRELLIAIRPDVVVAHSSKAGLIVRGALRGSLPTVFLPHAWSFAALSGPVAAAARTWERTAARWTSALVCVGAGEVETGLAAKVRAPYFLVPNPVPPRWTTGERRPAAELGEAGSADVVFVGRLSHQKGVDVLLEAWREVRASVPDATLAIVGNGPDAGSLRGAAGPGVVFAGEVSDPWSYTETAGIAVLPSRWEGLSLSMLEAMWSGRSVVTTDVDGCEVVQESRGGSVTPVGDTRALARALISRLQDAQLVASEGARAAAHVRQLHDFETAATRLAAVVSRAYAFGPLVCKPKVLGHSDRRAT